MMPAASSTGQRADLRGPAASLPRKLSGATIQAGRPTVLCLQRALFAKDIAELKKRTNLNLPCLRVVAVKKPQTRWVAPQWRRQAHLWHDLNNDLVSARGRSGDFRRRLS